MAKLRGESSFFRAGPPSEPGKPDPEVLAFLLAGTRGEVLDVGGGRGAYALALKSMGFSVTLAEVDRECLAEARQMGLPVIDMNITPWQELYGKFDTVTMVEVLEHVEDPEEFVSQASRCARGPLLVTVPANDAFEFLFRWGLTFNHVAVSDHLHHFTTADLEALMRRAGRPPTVKTGAFLFPDPLIGMFNELLRGHIFGRVALYPLRLLRRAGLLPRALPARLFAKA